MILRRSAPLIAIAIVSNVLITGGAGFIGGTLAAYLEHRGFDVTKFDITLGDSGLPDLLGQDIVIHLGLTPAPQKQILKRYWKRTLNTLKSYMKRVLYTRSSFNTLVVPLFMGQQKALKKMISAHH